MILSGIIIIFFQNRKKMTTNVELREIKTYFRENVYKRESSYDILTVCYYIIEIFRNETLENLKNIARASLILCLQFFEPDSSNRFTNSTIRKISNSCNSFDIKDVERSILMSDILKNSPFYYFEEKLNFAFDIIGNKLTPELKEEFKNKSLALIEEYFYFHGYDQPSETIVESCIIVSLYIFDLLDFSKTFELKLITDKSRALYTINKISHFYSGFEIFKNNSKNIFSSKEEIYVQSEYRYLSDELVPFEEDENLCEPSHKSWKTGISGQVVVCEKYVYRFSNIQISNYFPRKFIKEAICMRRLGRDFRIRQDKNNYILISERIKGESLSEFINKGKLNKDNLKPIFKSFLQELNKFQRFKILHNDIKPENAIIDNNEIKFIDFEFSSPIFSGPRICRVTNGTPVYFSPEKFGSETLLNFKSDIWSLGIVFVEMVRVISTGVSNEELVRGLYYETLFNTAKTVPQLRELVFNNTKEYITERICNDDPTLLDFCFRMLEKDFNIRADCSELLNHEWLL